MEPRGLVVSLKQAAFFPSGTDTIDPSTFPIIAKLAAALKEVVQSLAGGGAHRFGPDSHGPLPQQLGAVRGSQHRHDGAAGRRVSAWTISA